MPSRRGAISSSVSSTDFRSASSELEVRAKNGQTHATLEVTNHPITGPVFSGPQHPMYCTADRAPWNLGAVDEDCHVAAPRVTYRYRTTASTWANYPTDGSTPANIATTTTSAGATVPYVVRIERGTINRAVYETAILHQPGSAEPTPFAASAGWNGKLAYTFGGACGVGYWQGSSTGGVENDLLLSRGYAVASATFNVYAQNCNDVTSAETAMMVKEHVVEQLGPVTYTIGFGGSAGTMQQLLLSNNYPGILDGVLGEIGYPDERSTTIGGHDCRGPAELLELRRGRGLDRGAEGRGHRSRPLGHVLRVHLLRRRRRPQARLQQRDSRSRTAGRRPTRTACAARSPTW